MRLAPLLCLAPAALISGCAVSTGQNVSVLNYQVITPEPEYEYLARAIPEFLTNELANTPHIRVQDPQDVDRYMNRRWSFHDTSRLRGLGRSLGTDYFILGSVTRIEDEFVIESRLFSVNRGHVVPGTAFRETCHAEREILGEVRDIANRMRFQIEARVVPQAVPAVTVGAPAG